jgi:hypothetical protein
LLFDVLHNENLFPLGFDGVVERVHRLWSKPANHLAPLPFCWPIGIH